MSATLRQLGFSIELVYGNLDWALAETQLLRGVRVAFAKSFLAKAKVGLIGYHAPGFQDFHPERPLVMLGVLVFVVVNIVMWVVVLVLILLVGVVGGGTWGGEWVSSEFRVRSDSSKVRGRT